MTNEMSKGGSEVLIAVITLIATLSGTVLNEAIRAYRKRKADKPRKAILLQMLKKEHPDWRDLKTLSRVAGLTESEARRLLIEIGARGSETRQEGGAELWSLIERHPLP
jgi:macrodomain Ter protein organizer (MatP/YcbG family)